MATLATKLTASSKRIKKQVPAIRTKRLATGGGILAILAALREFCKHWPDIKKALDQAIADLRKNNQAAIAAVLDTITTFLNLIASVICPLLGRI